MTNYRTEPIKQPMIDLEDRLADIFKNSDRLKDVTFYNEDELPSTPVYPSCVYFGKNYQFEDTIGQGEDTTATFQFFVAARIELNNKYDNQSIKKVTTAIKEVLKENYTLDGYAIDFKISNIEFSQSFQQKDKSLIRYAIISGEYSVEY